jgi:hypothetical protein
MATYVIVPNDPGYKATIVEADPADHKAQAFIASMAGRAGGSSGGRTVEVDAHITIKKKDAS